MKLSIDGNEIEFFSEDATIIEVADRAHISIPAPCYRTPGTKGCCKSCVIEIDGTIAFACNTKPAEGMNIIVTRDDLKKIERERIEEYKKQQKEVTSACNCNCSNNKKCQ